MKEKFRVSLILFIAAILLCWSGGHAVALEGQHSASSNQSIKVELSSSPTSDLQEPVFRQDFVDSFERASLTPWTTSHIPAGGNHDWAIRDSNQTYGPGTCAFSGYRYPGYPPDNRAEYLNGTNPGWKSWIISPAIDITGWTGAYLSFAIWIDSEGTTSNYDGGYVEISSDNGVTWNQIDSVATGDLDPTYDERLLGSGQSGNMWSYSYDHQYWRTVITPDLIPLGYVSAGDLVKLRFTFDRDAVDGGQGFFIDDVAFTETEPGDNQPPVITHTPLTDTSDYQNPYTVSAEVVDYGDGLDTDSVYLYYKIEGGSWVSEKMINTGGDTYEAAIPPQDWWTDVYYYIEAADVVVPPNMGRTTEHYFEVGVAKLIAYDDGQGWWALSGYFVQGDGLFNMFAFADVGLDSVLLHKIIIFFNDMSSSLELQFYGYEYAWPAPLIDSAKGQICMGTGWEHWDITEICGESLKVYDYDAVMGGYIIPLGPDTLAPGFDITMEFPQNNWKLAGGTGGTWEQTFETTGDMMVRLKVIELPVPQMGVEETPMDHQNLDFSLTYSKPNPMCNGTVIEYQIPTAQKVTLKIYDVSGQLVKILLNTQKEAGTHQVLWNGLNEHGERVASGVYFYQLQGETAGKTRKLVVTR